jgi:hypothetical protein
MILCSTNTHTVAEQHFPYYLRLLMFLDLDLPPIRYPPEKATGLPTKQPNKAHGVHKTQSQIHHNWNTTDLSRPHPALKVESQQKHCQSYTHWVAVDLPILDHSAPETSCKHMQQRCWGLAASKTPSRTVLQTIISDR